MDRRLSAACYDHGHVTAVPRFLQEFVLEGKVIPFVGAGVSMAARLRDTGLPCYPSWSALLHRAADRLDQEHKPDAASEIRDHLAQRDFMAASTRARRALRSNWYRFLKSQLSRRHREVDEQSLALARAVWGIGSDLIITTNYDRVLLWACPELEDLTRWDIDAPYEQVSALRDGVDAPTVWHLHGLIDNVAKLILTPDGYQRLYPDAEEESSGDARTRHAAALATLQRHLTSFSFLFIGFSLDDAAFLEQLQSVDRVFDGAAATHYVLVRQAECAQMSAKIDAWGLPIDVIPFADFGAPLVELVTQIGRYSDATGSVGSGDAARGDSGAPAVGGASSRAEDMYEGFLDYGESRGDSAPGESNRLGAFEALEGDEDDDGIDPPTPADAPQREQVAKSMAPPKIRRPTPAPASAPPPPRESKPPSKPRPDPDQQPEAMPQPVPISDYEAPAEVLRGDRGGSRRRKQPKRDVSDGRPTHLEQILAIAGDFYSVTLPTRRSAAARTAVLSRGLPRADVLTLARSRDPGNRVAAGIAVRALLELDSTPATDPELTDAIADGLADPESRVRYRFVQALPAMPVLEPRLRRQLDTLKTDDNPTVAAKAREVVRIVGREPPSGGQ